ncbi:MAG: hypothetical protein V4611_00065 [Patescibacteria group bacterium]
MPAPLFAALMVLLMFTPYLIGGLIVQLFPNRIGLFIGILGWLLSVGTIVATYGYSLSLYPDWWSNGGGWPSVGVLIAAVIAIVSGIMVLKVADRLTDWT